MQIAKTTTVSLLLTYLLPLFTYYIRKNHISTIVLYRNFTHWSFTYYILAGAYFKKQEKRKIDFILFVVDSFLSEEAHKLKSKPYDFYRNTDPYLFTILFYC